MSDLFETDQSDAESNDTPRPSVDVSPGSYIYVPPGATEKDLEDVEESIADVRLNEWIRQAYESLKDDSGRFENGFRAAREEIAERFAVSEARVRRAVSGA